MEWWQTFGIAPTLVYPMIAGLVCGIGFIVWRLKARQNDIWDNDSTNNYTSKGRPVTT